MNKYEVRWKEMRMITCYAEVTALTAEEAVKLAQAYEVAVDEDYSYTEEIFSGKAELINEDINTKES